MNETRVVNAFAAIFIIYQIAPIFTRQFDSFYLLVRDSFYSFHS